MDDHYNFTRTYLLDTTSTTSQETRKQVDRYLELLALLLEFVELRGAEHISTGLHQFSNDVQGVVDGPVVVVNVILDLLNMERCTRIRIHDFSRHNFFIRKKSYQFAVVIKERKNTSVDPTSRFSADISG